MLDTTDPDALEAALRVYPGRALINSVNGGESSMASVLPLAARYGAAVVVLALDDDGIPATVGGPARRSSSGCATAPVPRACPTRTSSSTAS